MSIRQLTPTQLADRLSAIRAALPIQPGQLQPRLPLSLAELSQNISPFVTSRTAAALQPSSSQAVQQFLQGIGGQGGIPLATGQAGPFSGALGRPGQPAAAPAPPPAPTGPSAADISAFTRQQGSLQDDIARFLSLLEGVEPDSRRGINLGERLAEAQAAAAALPESAPIGFAGPQQGPGTRPPPAGTGVLAPLPQVPAGTGIPGVFAPGGTAAPPVSGAPGTVLPSGDLPPLGVLGGLTPLQTLADQLSAALTDRAEATGEIPFNHTIQELVNRVSDAPRSTGIRGQTSPSLRARLLSLLSDQGGALSASDITAPTILGRGGGDLFTQEEAELLASLSPEQIATIFPNL